MLLATVLSKRETFSLPYLLYTIDYLPSQFKQKII